MVQFWQILIQDKKGTIPSNMLKTLQECLTSNVHQDDWLVEIKQILNETVLIFAEKDRSQSFPTYLLNFFSS